MAIVRTDDQYYHDIADAIREKTGGTEDLLPENMAPELNAATLEPLTVTPTTEEQTFTPESPCIGFSSVTVEAAPDTGGGDSGGDSGDIGSSLPAAEGTAFGAVVTSYGLTINGSISTSSDTTTGGYKFTVTKDVTVTGFRLCGDIMVDFTIVLWDENGNEITRATLNPPSSSYYHNWYTKTLETPIYLSAGQTYTLSATETGGSGTTRTLKSNLTVNSLFTNVSFVFGYYSGTLTCPTYSSGSYIYGIPDLILAIPSDEEFPDEYSVQRTTMDAIAAEVKRVTGNVAAMTPESMIEALKSV